MKLLKTLVICLLISQTYLTAQNSNRAISEFEKQTQAQISVNESFGIAEFIKLPVDKPLKVKGSSLKEMTFNFLETNKAIYNINNVSNSFVSEAQEIDNLGFKRLVLNQNYKGVPIYAGKLLFHFNTKDELTAVNGNFIPDIKLNAVPSLTKAKANAIAVQTIENQNINYSGETLLINKSTLYVFSKGLAQGHFYGNYLVYEVEVRNNLDVREFVFVNAHTGDIVQQFTGIAHALDRVVYEGNTSTVVWQEGDTLPGGLTNWQLNEVIASEHVYNFFNNAFGFASYDGADAQMRTINNNPNINCPNANWNGSTANYCDGTAADDVIAHEWGHAYTDGTCNLIYQWQSGAINESLSDIWGETVDILNNYEDGDEDLSLRTAGCASSDRWRMGEDATAFPNPIRDMWNPPCNGDPGKVTDGQYSCGAFDSGGVHINSGIPNHAYALLVDGGSYNGQVINAIGFTKAAHIFWRAQSQYLIATSDFTALADALEASAQDLLGVNLEGLSTTGTPAGLSGEIITASDVNQVLAAVLAVELRINPDVCGYTSVLTPIADLCEASTNNPVFFEDWETGMDGWSVGQLPINATTWEPRDWALSSTLPLGRVGTAMFGVDPINGNCSDDLENGRIRLLSPIITMPDYPNGNFDMAFTHYVSTEANWDGANIKASVDSGAWAIVPASAFTENGYNGIINPTSQGNDNPMAGQEAYTGSDGGSNTGSWGTSVIDLSLIGVSANSTVQFRFEVGTDGCNGREGWYIDDLIIYNCTELLSVDEFASVDSFVKIFPNPSKGIFNIKATQGKDLQKAEVYDINGRLIKAVDLSNGNTTSIDISSAANGMYFMTITAKDVKGVVKLIKE